ncbi:hypothetical protein Y032_0078g1199 [Ancylostoma ceylanicum]|uniref:Uncharacterized protein n=1 Tax=Ancylostoma ceylanicum TaxID=53326 RepID=A0A016TTQ4_9BILA|nr:hypothetical protein Y032_0078g1199 [Ancylostoma ceylanicum]
MSFHLNMFNFDGLDGNWRDLRNESQFFSRGYFGGDTVMVWSGFCPKGRLDIAFILTSVTSSDCSELFRVQLLFFQNQCNGILLIFQQNNTAIHDGGSKTAWFVDNTVTVMASLTCQGSNSDRMR